MIRCPKCGFDQPPDRYCAKCGVDISLFRPTPRFFSQLLAPGFYIFLIAVLLLSSAYFVYQNRSHQFGAPPTELSSTRAPDQPISSSNPQSLGAQNLTTAAPQPTLAEGPSPSPEKVVRGETLLARDDLKALEPTATAPPPTQTDRFSFQIMYMETPIDLINQFPSLDQSSGLFTTAQSFREFRERWNEAMTRMNAPLLFESEASSIQGNQGLVINQEALDKRVESKSGFSLELKPSWDSDGRLKLAVKAHNVFPELSGNKWTPVTASVSKQFLMKEGQVAYVRGLVPARNVRTDVEKESFVNHRILKILASPHFSAVSPETDLIVFIEFLPP